MCSSDLNNGRCSGVGKSWVASIGHGWGSGVWKSGESVVGGSVWETRVGHGSGLGSGASDEGCNDDLRTKKYISGKGLQSLPICE